MGLAATHTLGYVTPTGGDTASAPALDVTTLLNVIFRTNWCGLEVQRGMGGGRHVTPPPQGNYYITLQRLVCTCVDDLQTLCAMPLFATKSKARNLEIDKVEGVPHHLLGQSCAEVTWY